MYIELGNEMKVSFKCECGEEITAGKFTECNYKYLGMTMHVTNYNCKNPACGKKYMVLAQVVKYV